MSNEKETIHFSEEDIAELETRGITVKEASEQVKLMREGIPFLDIVASASLERGVVRIDGGEEECYVKLWDEYLRTTKADVLKMVPASGAASRMFKDLYNFLDGERDEPETESEKIFFEQITNFAFYELLNEACLRNDWKSAAKLIESGRYKDVVRNLLLPIGLGYGSMPKALIRFHRKGKELRTAAAEHLAEGAMYAQPLSGRVRVQFTTAPEYQEEFDKSLESQKRTLEDEYCIRYDITYSEQNPATDTLSLNENGMLQRDAEGKLLFRPGGHGALIRNLDQLDADVVFIKNVDNVVPDEYKGDTIVFKKLLGGILIAARQKVYDHLEKVSNAKVSRSDLNAALGFLSDNFCVNIPSVENIADDDLAELLRQKLDRPIRVCGMVKNVGEPGGGPFIIKESDGTTSLQILESSQIDMENPRMRSFFEEGSFFNPVDLVCSTRRMDGSRFFLQQYINPRTAFISHKTYGGKPIVALERPGLWNGAMHHWLTIFVEVPLSTFNPVKTVNDLLRPEHQL